MRKLLALFLFALPLCAQSIPIVNPSFESPQALNADPLGAWEYGVIPGWTVSGATGLWQPANYASVPDGKVVAFSNGGSLTQDLGVAAQANTLYTLTVDVGHRPDDYPTTYTIALGSCALSGKTSDIPIGTFVKQTLNCPVTTTPAGNLVITLSSAGAQANFDNVTLAMGPLPPFVLKLAGLTNLTFLLSDPAQLPVCKLSEGTCSLIIAVCFTDSGQCANGVKGSVSVVKVTNSSTTSTQVIQASP